MRKRFWDDFATAYKIGKDLWESNARVREQEGLSNAMRDAMQEQSQQVYGGASPEEIARAQAEADRLSAQDAAEFGLTPEEQRIYAPQVATQKVVGARYGLGAVPTDWRDTPYTQEEKFQNALRAGADYYLRSGDMDKYMDYKAKVSQLAAAGLQRQALESQLQDREDQRRRENEFRNYVAGSSLGGLQGIKAAVERTGGTWTPEAEAIYAKQGYATNQVDFMKGITRYMADPAQVMNAMKLVDNFQKEGVLNALRLAASGASKEEVAQAFNGVGDIRANVTDLKQGTWVNPYTGKKETTTYLTYQTPDGKTGTVNVTEQLLRYEDAAKLMQLSLTAKHYDDWARVMAQRAAGAGDNKDSSQPLGLTSGGELIMSDGKGGFVTKPIMVNGKPATPEEINTFKKLYGLSKPAPNLVPVPNNPNVFTNPSTGAVFVLDPDKMTMNRVPTPGDLDQVKQILSGKGSSGGGGLQAGEPYIGEPTKSFIPTPRLDATRPTKQDRLYKDELTGEYIPYGAYVRKYGKPPEGSSYNERLMYRLFGK